MTIVPGSGTYDYNKKSIFKNPKKYTFGEKIPVPKPENFDTLCKYSPQKPT